jgi:hypothetical protein
MSSEASEIGAFMMFLRFVAMSEVLAPGAALTNDIAA